MDPASAIGVASSAIAFLEFGAKLISATKAIYDSKDGILPEHTEIEQHYKDLLASSSDLDIKMNGRALCSDDVHFQKLSSKFRHDCQAIVDLLNAHRCNEGKRRRRILGSVKAAFKLPGVKEQLHDIEERLDKTQKAMQLHVFQQLRYVSKMVLKISTVNTDSTITRQEISGVRLTVVAIQGHGNTLTMQPSNLTAADNEKDPSSLSIQDIRALMGQLSDTVRTLEHLRVESVLASLNYETREVRHDTIHEAHAKTFEWALEPKFPLSVWLQSGDGIFWVSGKPGSGKSTLMKFLADHKQAKVESFLKQWAGDNKLVVASHYFWCSGTQIQKSWDGLLRSLIFDIFRSCPLAIQEACPGRWARAGAPGAASTPWTITELAKTLRAVADLQDRLSLRFCFFIDGLDEYDGDHLKLCEIFKDLVRAGTIKMCLSSRPWPVFEDGLGKDLSRKLYVQDLTFEDITTFVAEQLEYHPEWKDNHLTDDERMEMVKAVSSKADGVFLWAYLVTRSLREGLSNHDTLTGLRKRLDQVPADLKKLFRQILESVDYVYQSKMACFLQAALIGHSLDRAPDAGIYCNMERELDEPGYALHSAPHKPSTESRPGDEFEEWLHGADNLKLLTPELRTHLLKRYNQMQRVINSRTKGILETHLRYFPRPPDVVFFHRTMYDFLQTQEMKEFLASKLSSDFNIHLWFMKGRLTRAKRYPVGIYNNNSGFLELYPEVSEELFSVLGHAIDALTTIKEEQFSAVFALLDEYEGTLHQLGVQALTSHPSCRMLLVARSGGRRAYINLTSYFREVVIISACRLDAYGSLRNYVATKIKEIPDYTEAVDAGILLHLSTFTLSFMTSWYSKDSSLRPDYGMVELLLRTGVNLNKPFLDRTATLYYNYQTMARVGLRPQVILAPWILLMRAFIPVQGFITCLCFNAKFSDHITFVLPQGLPIISLFLNYGANPDEELCSAISPIQIVSSEPWSCQVLNWAWKNRSVFRLPFNVDFSRDHETEFFGHSTFSKPPLWYISCFFAYIWYPFQNVFPAHTHSDYLATLNTFLSKNPRLDRANYIDDVITSLEVARWIILNGDDEPSKSPFVQFCAHICYQDTWTEDSALNQFRSAIIEKLVVYCGTINAHEKFFTLLEFGISKAEKCPEVIKRRLLELVEKNRSLHETETGSQTEDRGKGTEEV